LSSLSFLLCHPNAKTAYRVVIDELNSSLFERCLNFDQSRDIARKEPFLAFNTADGCNANFGRLSNILLAPAEKRAGSAELRDLKHTLAELFDSGLDTPLKYAIFYVI
jgi:hypothetical protein